MNKRKDAVLKGILLTGLSLAFGCPGVWAAEENTKTAPVSASDTGENPDVAKLKIQLAEQAQQLDRLRVELENQKKLIDGMLGRPAVAASAAEALPAAPAPASPRRLGEVASLTPMAPAAPAAPNAIPSLPLDMQKTDEQKPSPLSLQVGNAYLTPIGFMDFTTVNRTSNLGSGIGSNFGSIPYNNTPNGHLSEMRLSAQNSRFGFRFDSVFSGALVTGYMESDFLGNNAGNVAVTSNSNTARMRLYWVDVRKNGFELMAGQSWSLLTPGRKGISPLPSDLFYSQDIDVNYQIGLTWARIPTLRLVARPNKSLSMAVAIEQAEQYVGGSAGGSTIVPPSALATQPFGQFNNGASTLATPNLNPDVIAKIAWDPSSHFHGEIAGVYSTFKDFNPLTNRHYTVPAGGGSLNLGFDVAKGFRILTNNFYGDGEGRWFFGQAPDLVLKENGNIGLLHSASTVSGAEWTLGKTLLYAYYGGIYVQKYVVIDPANRNFVGYGYPGSSNAQNKSIQEGTFGFNQTVWKDAKYGAINIMGQYSYLSRAPWYIAANSPRNAHQNQIYFNLRYTLPGSAPSLK